MMEDRPPRTRPTRRSALSRKAATAQDYLEGQCLIAMPGMSDRYFQGTVVYLYAHSAEGAMGLVLNQPSEDLKFPELLVQLGIVQATQDILLPEAGRHVPVLRGGPVESGRGFVLHSAEYVTENATLAVAEGISLTHSIDILRALAAGSGPRRAVLALGYAGWGAGQLETEIRNNGWLHCPADATLLFDVAPAAKYAVALGRLGAQLAQVSAQAGNA